MGAPHRKARTHLLKSDPILAGLIRKVGPCRLAIDANSPFEALAEAILYQQISGKAAASIYKKLLGVMGTKRLSPGAILALSDAQLRSAGLSRQKSRYLRDLADQTTRGLPLRRVHRMGDEEVVEVLTAVKGIGRWTAHMFLMFRLGRPDVLPVDDYGIQKAMKLAYRLRALPKPDRMARIAEPWRPHRSVACWYLWRSLGD
jgi:DNA-3-methyladenine glycosylase II